MQPDVKVVLDLGGVIRKTTLANALAAETLDDWLGRHWVETVEDADRAQLDALVDTALVQGVSPYCRVTQRFPSGQSIPIEYMAVRLKGVDMIAIGRDVRVLAPPGGGAGLSAIRRIHESNYPRLDEAGLSRGATANYLSGHGPLAQFLGSMTEQLGTTTLKGLVSATVGLVEKHYIEAALAEAQGNRTAAAKMLGLSRQSLYVKMSRYEISDDHDSAGLTRLCGL